IFTGLYPYHKYFTEASVIFRIVNGEHPRQPEKAMPLGLDDRMRGLMKKCWDSDWEKRPDTRYVLREV
ncbi:hypothetical protein OBBRIDRAFT_733433, partial [Obba rivulosa]